MKDEKPFEIVEYTQTETDLAELRTQLSDVVFDCTTPKGMKEAKSSRMLLVKVRTGLEKLRVSIKAPALERTRAIDSEAKRITANILELEEPIQAQIKVEEDRAATEAAETARLAAEAKAVWVNKIANIKARPLAFINSPAEVIGEAIEKARAAIDAVVPRFPEDLQLEARSAFKGAVEQMTQMYLAAKDREETAAKLAALESAQPEIAGDDGISNGPSDAGSTPSPVVQSYGRVDTDTGEVTAFDAGGNKITNMPDGTEMHSKILSEKSSEDAATDNLLWTGLLISAEAVIGHYGQFKKPHETIIALTEAVENVKAV
jgi:hypothetical protein